MMRELMAEVYDTIGRSVLGVESSHRKRLRELGRKTTPMLQAVFRFSQPVGVLRRDWPAAASFANLEIDAARMVQNGRGAADGLLSARTRLVRTFREGPRAGEDVTAARAVIASHS